MLADTLGRVSACAPPKRNPRLESLECCLLDILVFFFFFKDGFSVLIFLKILPLDVGIRRCIRDDGAVHCVMQACVWH